MKLVLIAAADRNLLIGTGTGLPWHLPGDLKRFRARTMGRPMVMGRRTWETIGKPLPGRTSVVVSRSPAFSAPGCEVAGSLDEALARAVAHGGDEVVVGGGAALYEEALPRCERVALTLVLGHFDCDTFLPTPWRQGPWRVRTEAFHPADEQNAYPCVFLDLERALPG